MGVVERWLAFSLLLLAPVFAAACGASDSTTTTGAPGGGAATTAAAAGGAQAESVRKTVACMLEAGGAEGRAVEVTAPIDAPPESAASFPPNRILPQVQGSGGALIMFEGPVVRSFVVVMPTAREAASIEKAWSEADKSFAEKYNSAPTGVMQLANVVTEADLDERAQEGEDKAYVAAMDKCTGWSPTGG